MAQSSIDERLDGIETGLSALRSEIVLLHAEMATKADLAGIAKNVEIRALQRFSESLRAEVRLLTGLVQALVDHQTQIVDRLTALENPMTP